MRDLIWTIITIWFLWRIIEAFRSYSPSRRSQSTANTGFNTNSADANAGGPERNKKAGLKPDAGEYVDFEEVK